MGRDSSDDDSDSDFEPEDGGGKGAEEDKGQKEKKPSTRVLAERKRRVDDAWAELHGQSSMTRAVLEGGSKKKKKTDGGGVGKKAKAVLAGIFGSSTASQLVSSIGTSKQASSGAAAPLPERKLQAPTKVTVTEKFKYAGKDIEIKRTVVKPGGDGGAGAVSGNGGGKKPAAKGALDKMLDELKGPQSINTVAKSSYDWDSFKQEKGLDEELAKVTKDGYLHRKDFLERCDVRQFEQERDARNVKRAKEAAVAASQGANK